MEENNFVYDSTQFNENSEPWSFKTFNYSEFDKQLRGKWTKAVDDGYFRYRLDDLETKIVPGSKKYVAQLNVKRGTERRKPQEINTVNQPFDPNLFNFTKIKKEETLFHLKHKSCPNGQPTNGDRIEFDEKTNLVIINVSPLEFGHILIVPDVHALQPQVLTEECLRLGVETLLLSRHRGYRVGFNSLCALSSVNHQHLHAYYVEHELFVEHCPVKHLKGILYELDEMPVPGFAFQLHGSSLEYVVREINKVTQYFMKNEIAHNLFITRGSVFGEDSSSTNRTIRFFLWPRVKFIGVKVEACFNVAVVELAGHLPIKIEEQYAGLTEEYIDETLRTAKLDGSEYNKIKDDVINLFSDNSS